MKRKLARYETPPSDLNEPWIRIEAEWRKINEEKIQKLVESMPTRSRSKTHSKNSKRMATGTDFLNVKVASTKPGFESNRKPMGHRETRAGTI